MKKNILLLPLAALTILASCGGQPAAETSSSPSSGEEPSSSQGGSDSSSSLGDSTNSGFGGSSLDSGNPSSRTIADFTTELEEFLANLPSLHKATLSQRRYVAPSDSGTGNNALTKIDFTYYNGPFLHGRAKYSLLEGEFEYKELSEGSYEYDIQCYTEGDYLLYVSKLPRGVTGRISYADIEKNNRYNNIYTKYESSIHIGMVEDSLEAINGNYWSSASFYTVDEPTIREIDGKAILNMTAERPGTSEYGGAKEFVRVTIDEASGDLLDIETQIYVYDIDLQEGDEGYLRSIIYNKLEGVEFGEFTDYTGTVYSEADVDRSYGVAKQRKIDYSSFPDGTLSDAQASLILSNIQSYGEGTVKSEATFTIPQLVNVFEGYYGADANSGEYILGGELSGNIVTTLYNGSFVDSVGTMSYYDEDKASSYPNFSFNRQVSADDEGITIIEDYGAFLPDHKHVNEASGIDDVDPYLGINPIYLEDVSDPALIAGQIGTNCAENSPLDDDWTTYTSAGTLTKSGTTITGVLTRVYVRNVWTPYRTFSVNFKIEDNFLSEYSFTEETYFESDSSKYEFGEVSYSFKNYKGEPSDFTGTVLDPADYSEYQVTEYEVLEDSHEGLYF